MKRDTAIQFFALLAIIAAGLLCYVPPKDHVAEAWALITLFLGYAIRDLFGHTSAPEVASPNAPPAPPAS